MVDLIEEMQVYYARRAPQYDASMGYDDPDRVASLSPVADSLHRQLAGRRCLEIACGPGFWTRVVSEAARSIAATDYNEPVLAQARRKDWGSRAVSFLVADAYDLSMVPGRFDGTFAVDWLAHVPGSRSKGFLEGLHARLEPGARVVFCDQTPWPESFTGVFDDEGNHLQERELPDGSRFRVIKHFRSDDDYRALFAPWAAELTIERVLACRRGRGIHDSMMSRHS